MQVNTAVGGQPLGCRVAAGGSGACSAVGDGQVSASCGEHFVTRDTLRSSAGVVDDNGSATDGDVAVALDTCGSCELSAGGCYGAAACDGAVFIAICVVSNGERIDRAASGGVRHIDVVIDRGVRVGRSGDCRGANRIGLSAAATARTAATLTGVIVARKVELTVGGFVEVIIIEGPCGLTCSLNGDAVGQLGNPGTSRVVEIYDVFPVLAGCAAECYTDAIDSLRVIGVVAAAVATFIIIDLHVSRQVEGSAGAVCLDVDGGRRFVFNDVEVAVGTDAFACFGSIVDDDCAAADVEVAACLDANHIARVVVLHDVLTALGNRDFSPFDEDFVLTLEAFVAVASRGECDVTVGDVYQAVALDGGHISFGDRNVERASTQDDLSVEVIAFLSCLALNAVALHTANCDRAAVHLEVLTSMDAVAFSADDVDAASRALHEHIFLRLDSVRVVAFHCQRAAFADLEMSLTIQGCFLSEAVWSVLQIVLRPLEQLEGDAFAALDVECRTCSALQAQASQSDASLECTVVCETALGAFSAEDETHLAVLVGIRKSDCSTIHLAGDASHVLRSDRCLLSVVGDKQGVCHNFGGFIGFFEGDAVHFTHVESVVADGYLVVCEEYFGEVELGVRTVLPEVKTVELCGRECEHNDGHADAKENFGLFHIIYIMYKRLLLAKIGSFV